MKFSDEGGKFDVDGFRHAVDLLITAQDILVDNSSYPTEEIGETAGAYRQLGLGYANLGALLMSQGLAYDSDEGRAYAGAVTSLMCGEAYAQSTRIAEALGAYAGYAKNMEPQLRVIDKHRQKAREMDSTYVPLDILSTSRDSWDTALERGRTYGVRNSQVTVLAPTGTIAFMMDCDTTGVEPDIALVKSKKLVGGGVLKYVNRTVPSALARLGYESRQVEEIVDYIDQMETIEGAPHLADEHLKVFDCAFRPRNGIRTIEPLGHIRMMGAVQPYISGAISKTVNLPSEATVDDVENAYIESWRLGLKAIAVYRDGCKRTQPLNTGNETDGNKSQSGQPATTSDAAQPARRRLPADCASYRHKFDIQGHEGYIHVGFFEDGTPGEIFIKMAKEGSTISGLMDTIATLTSLSLQYGVPLQALVKKFEHVRFEPAGFTKNPDIPVAKSLTDYIFRFFGTRFGGPRPVVSMEREPVAVPAPSESAAAQDAGLSEVAKLSGAEPADGYSNGSGTRLNGADTSVEYILPEADAPSCSNCGSIMVRNGACYKCLNCGDTSGCS
jgi:ribonucleoside-diphosphate reductase alpha chain